MIDLFPRTIAPRYHLDREQRYWLVRGQQRNIRLLSPSRQSFGFSLDVPDPDNPPLGFFGGSPPKHIAKMCDGMAAVLRRDRLYLFAVEIKTADKGDANRQLANGRLFWRWLMELYRRHGHLPEALTISYIRLLAWQPEEQPADRQSSTFPDVDGPLGRPSPLVQHKKIAPFPGSGNLKKVPTSDGFDACFEAENLVVIPLAALTNQC